MLSFVVKLFAGVFSVLWQIVKGVFIFMGEIFSEAMEIESDSDNDAVYRLNAKNDENIERCSIFDDPHDDPDKYY